MATVHSVPDCMPSTSAIVLTLEEEDIEGATLEEPLDGKTIPQLRWWLLCHGIEAASSERKAALIQRIRKAKSENVGVIDVDRTYLERKRQRLLSSNVNVAPLPYLSFPLEGWQTVEESNAAHIAKQLPSVSHTTLYTYLAEGVGNAKGSLAFRALKRGYVHWASGRMKKLEVQTRHPNFTFVRSTMIPSMRSGTYSVKLLLENKRVQDQLIGEVCQASCECAAGLSACCVHVSALLHALVSLTPSAPCPGSDVSSDEETTPCTSLPCKWKPPCKRKAMAQKVSATTFQKHEYGKAKQYNIQSMETFDPRPESMRNTASDRLPQLLEDVRGKGLCISLLLDTSVRVETPGEATTQTSLSKAKLLETVAEFKKKLQVSEEDVRRIEVDTRGQSNSVKWFEARRFRLTASMFGRVRQLKPSTPPDNLVLTVLGVKRISGAALQYGRSMEATALDAYVKYQHSKGHPDLYATASGVILSCTHPFLGASPDASVYDPSNSSDPFGFVEIKCPFKYKDVTPACAATNKDFMLERELGGRLVLKRTHIYFSQVQGQMGIGGRKWCDFVVYTSKGINVDRVHFDPQFWECDLLPKLCDFYNMCVAPEIVCPRHPFGLPLRDLRNE